MSRIGAADRIAALDGIKHRAINNVTRQPAVADSYVFAIPSLRQPHLEAQLWKHRTDHPAQPRYRPRRDSRRPEHPGRHRSSRTDRNSRQGKVIQLLAAL